MRSLVFRPGNRKVHDTRCTSGCEAAAPPPRCSTAGSRFPFDMLGSVRRRTRIQQSAPTDEADDSAIRWKTLKKKKKNNLQLRHFFLPTSACTSIGTPRQVEAVQSRRSRRVIARGEKRQAAPSSRWKSLMKLFISVFSFFSHCSLFPAGFKSRKQCIPGSEE